jgi:hypothetical protein
VPCTQVSIAGRRLDTGEIVQPDIIHLQDFSGHSGTGEGKLLLVWMHAAKRLPCAEVGGVRRKAALTQQLPDTCLLFTATLLQEQ